MLRTALQLVRVIPCLSSSCVWLFARLVGKHRINKQHNRPFFFLPFHLLITWSSYTAFVFRSTMINERLKKTPDTLHANVRLTRLSYVTFDYSSSTTTLLSSVISHQHSPRNSTDGKLFFAPRHNNSCWYTRPPLTTAGYHLRWAGLILLLAARYMFSRDQLSSICRMLLVGQPSCWTHSDDRRYFVYMLSLR